MWHREIRWSYFGQERVVQHRCVFSSWRFYLIKKSWKSPNFANGNLWAQSTTKTQFIPYYSQVVLPLDRVLFWWPFMACTLFQGLCLHMYLFEVVGMQYIYIIWWRHLMQSTDKVHTKKHVPRKIGTILKRKVVFQPSFLKGYVAGWWCQTFFIFTPSLGEDSHFGKHIFQMGGSTTNQFTFRVFRGVLTFCTLTCLWSM